MLARIRKGEFPYFSSRWIDVGFPPNWTLNPYSGKSAPNNGHFSQINEFGFGDVKAIWETSRFGFVFYLARGYARTGNDQFAETYWELLENWMETNSPYEGINWKCGQESGLRFLAAAFGLFVFSRSSATTPERLNRFSRLAAATANRIDKHIAYAISQKNNHGISEAVALWSIGILFPELKHSDAWQAKGLKVLVQLCDELIYEDGAFSQHSVNYHRLVLHLLAWSIRLAEANSIQLPHSIVDSFRRATRFVSALIAGNDGQVPRYGNDDGAKILALNHCDYFDFRPLVQLCHTIAYGQRSFEAGPWDEDLFWFGISIKKSEVAEQPMSPGRKSFPNGGIHRIHLENTTAFVRGGKFRHRPTQSDQMHVDIWWNGHNIAIDPGTYSYNGEDDWREIPLMKNQFHNSVLVDGKEPEQQVSKFLLLPWNDTVRVIPKKQPKFLAMEWSRKLNFGLEHSVEHHRAVSVLPNDVLVVLDGLWSRGEHLYQLNWLLGEKDWDLQDKLQGKLRLQIDSSDYYVHVRGNGKTELDCATGVEGSARGWFAPHYLERQPTLSCQLTTQGRNVLFFSLFSSREPQLARLDSMPFPSISEPECLLDSGFISQINKAINE